MRYFTASFELFDQIRNSVMAQHNQPNNKADGPWKAGINIIALSNEECDAYTDLLSFALSNGATEITEEEYFTRLIDV